MGNKIPPSITAIILTYNEELHIERCLASLLPVVESIMVIDSYSTDRTVEIAEMTGATVFQRKWKNHADQFQWGIDNTPIKTDWVMRIDADEYLEPTLQQEIVEKIPELSSTISGIYIKRKVMFMGQWIRHGGFYPHIVLRIWRTGAGRVEQRWMDEHIVLTNDGATSMFEQNLVDENLKGITFWVDKHNGYASREMVDLLNMRFDLFPRDDAIKQQSNLQAKLRRLIKESIYMRLPPALRASLYFIYRYIFRLGFMDGKEGFIFHVMQGFWYRLLVDIKVMEVLKKSGGELEKMKSVISDEYNIKL